MDANGLRFWMLADEADWFCDPGADYDAKCRRLRLRSGRDRALPGDVNGDGAETEARSALEHIAQTHDGVGARAFWDAPARVLGAASEIPGAVQIWTPPIPATPDDFALGYDGILYVAIGGTVVMHDLRGRWGDVTLKSDDFQAWRITADPAGGVWLLDRASQQLAHVDGEPLPDRPFAPYTSCTVRPCQENPEPPHLTLLPQLTWEGEAVALACAPGGRLGLLVWRTGEDARLHVQGEHGAIDVVVRLRGVQFPFTFAWTADDAIATRVTRLPREALVYEIADAVDESARGGVAFDPAVEGFEPSGDVYPLRDPVDGPFSHVLALPPRYPAAMGLDDHAEPTVPLHRLSAPAYRDEGEARGARPFDSGTTATVWHRLYVEAVIPPHSDFRVYLAATDEAAPPDVSVANEWHEHRFGELPLGSDTGRAVPRAAWVSASSEIPYHRGLLGAAGEDGRKGLFTVLIQRSNRPVRTLRGRYLWVRVALRGDRRGTPEIAALRAYGSRFSYVEHYLPALYHEQLFGRERDTLVPDGARPATTAPDFLERFVCNFEGVFTMLEDRIGDAWLLTDPRTTSEDSLEWLASWIGVEFDPACPAAQRRELIAAAPHLFRWRGTLRGLRDALGIVTGGRFANGRVEGGSVNDGEIVILENWRLRRTMATILGADLANEDDPLLVGLTVSGNSLVGDTLVLGDEDKKEFLALFAAGIERNRSERGVVANFFDALAHRVTVLVHQEVSPQDLGLVRRIVELERPAHVVSQVVTARLPFLVAVSSLVGVDTYLAAPEPRRPVEINRSVIGVRDFLLSTPSLDPRLGMGETAPVLGRGVRPVAVVRGPAIVQTTGMFPLDASESRARGDARIARFSWRQLT